MNASTYCRFEEVTCGWESVKPHVRLELAAMGLLEIMVLERSPPRTQRVLRWVGCCVGPAECIHEISCAIQTLEQIL